MKLTKRKLSKGFTLVELLVVIAIIAALAAMATPVVMKQQKKAALTTATSNAKQIFLLAFEFDQDFGSFPNADTATDLTGAAASANDCFRQFFLANLIESEEIFFAKGGAPTAGKPDQDIGVGPAYANACVAGEVGFNYYMGLSTSNSSGLPIISAPAPTGANVFETGPYGGKAVVLRIDGSCQQYRVNDAGKAIVTGATGLEDQQVYLDNAADITVLPPL